MADIVDKFRAKLSEELKSAMVKRDKEDVSTIRSIMSALDNGSALSKEEIAKLQDTSMTEVPRKKMSEEDIEKVLQSELAIRKSALSDYQKLGNQEQIAIVEKSITTIHKLGTFIR